MRIDDAFARRLVQSRATRDIIFIIARRINIIFFYIMWHVCESKIEKKKKIHRAVEGYFGIFQPFLSSLQAVSYRDFLALFFLSSFPFFTLKQHLSQPQNVLHCCGHNSFKNVQNGEGKGKKKKLHGAVFSFPTQHY